MNGCEVSDLVMVGGAGEPMRPNLKTREGTGKLTSADSVRQTAMASPSLPTHPGSIPRRSSPYLLAFPVGLLVLVSLTLIHLFPAMTSSPGHHLPPLGGHQRPFPAPSHGNNSASFKIGTLNLRYDGGWRETVPVGHSGDGREEKAGGGPGERVSSSPASATICSPACHCSS